MLRPPTIYKKTILHTKEEFLNFVNENNGITNIFVNLYHFTRSECCNSFYYFDNIKKKYICNKCKNVLTFFNLDSFIIDCIVFDIDPTPNTKRQQFRCYLKMKRLNRYFREYEHYIAKSGKGFHFYIRTKPATDEDFEYGGRNALRHFQVEVEKMFGETDYITHGDTSQMIRVPGTWNINSRCYCFFLTKKDLKLTYNQLCRKSEKQQKIKIEPITFGKKIDLKKFDKKIEGNDFIHEGELTIDFNRSENKENDLKKIFNLYNADYEKFAPCIKIMMNNEFLDYNQRFLLINFIKNLGVSLEDCEKILYITLFTNVNKKSTDEKKRYNWARHCINEERIPFYIYRKDYGIPSCKSGVKLGFEKLKICDSCKIKNIMNFR